MRRPVLAVLALGVAAWAVHPIVFRGPIDEVAPDGPAVASAAPRPADPLPPPHATIAIKRFEYRPAVLHVQVGTRVTWRNDDIANHTITFRGADPGSIDNIDPHARASRVFRHPGRFTYICAVHPFMQATVVVHGS